MFRPRKRSFWAIGDIKQPTNQPNGRLSKNRRHPKLPQDIRDFKDPIESDPPDLKKWWLNGCGFAINAYCRAKNGPDGRLKARRTTKSTQECCLFGVPPWWLQKIWLISKKLGFLSTKTGFFAQKSAFSYATPLLAPLFWAPPDPIQWDHKFSILWGTLGPSVFR